MVIILITVIHSPLAEHRYSFVTFFPVNISVIYTYINILCMPTANLRKSNYIHENLYVKNAYFYI